MHTARFGGSFDKVIASPLLDRVVKATGVKRKGHLVLSIASKSAWRRQFRLIKQVIAMEQRGAIDPSA
jgi:hypothetical protein